MEVAPGAKKHLLSAFYDFTFAYAQLKPETVQVRKDAHSPFDPSVKHPALNNPALNT